MLVENPELVEDENPELFDQGEEKEEWNAEEGPTDELVDEEVTEG